MTRAARLAPLLRSAWGSVLLWLAVAGAAAAEPQVLEAVGVVPVPEGELATRDTRDGAVQEALREAVLTVARELLMDAGTDEGSEEVGDDRLQRVLGKSVLPYTRGYRIVDDQGERPVMFGGEDDGRSEYVVVVEVRVETDLVEQRLLEAGLLARDAAFGQTIRVRVEVRGLLHHPAYEAFRALLEDAAGAVSVVPVEFTHGRFVLDVDFEGRAAAGATADIVERLVSASEPELTLEAVSIDPTAIVLAALWTPPLAEPEEGEL